MNFSFETVAPGIHPAIAVIAISVYFRYGLRTKLVTESLAGCNSLIDELRVRVVRGLDEDLSDVLDSLKAVAPVILRPDGMPYEELPADRRRSEAFMNALTAFAAHGGAGILSDLRVAIVGKEQWLFWAKIISWAVVLTIILEIGIIFSGLCLLWASRPLFDLLIPYSLVPAGLCVSSCILPLVPLHLHHDRIIELKASYDVS